MRSKRFVIMYSYCEIKCSKTKNGFLQLVPSSAVSESAMPPGSGRGQDTFSWEWRIFANLPTPALSWDCCSSPSLLTDDSLDEPTSTLQAFLQLLVSLVPIGWLLLFVASVFGDSVDTAPRQHRGYSLGVTRSCSCPWLCVCRPEKWMKIVETSWVYIGDVFLILEFTSTDLIGL